MCIRDRAYIRYMDDFVILSPDKEQLRNWLARIEQFLREELKLEFNPKTTILDVYKRQAEDWAWYFATFIANGIFPKPSDGLQMCIRDSL